MKKFTKKCRREFERVFGYICGPVIRINVTVGEHVRCSFVRFMQHNKTVNGSRTSFSFPNHHPTTYFTDLYDAQEVNSLCKCYNNKKNPTPKCGIL